MKAVSCVPTLAEGAAPGDTVVDRSVTAAGWTGERIELDGRTIGTSLDSHTASPRSFGRRAIERARLVKEAAGSRPTRPIDGRVNTEDRAATPVRNSRHAAPRRACEGAGTALWSPHRPTRWSEGDAIMDGRKPGRLDGLVDIEKGIVSREIFVSEEIYRQELERVFARAWLFLGHESQIPRPGDYVVSSMGEESVIVCRDSAGRVRVFLNSCRHRGMKVCRYDEGHTVEFLCPYHGWSYGTDGALVGVPHARDAYGAQLDRDRWGLIEVARMASYKGTIWATWDPEAPSFLDYLGGYKLYTRWRQLMEAQSWGEVTGP
jgi:nitrite reductase/ring-hydroxylating ferredoxin subunit